MINKKVSTIAGSLIILVIVAVLGFIFFSGKEKEMQNQNDVVLKNSNLWNKGEVTKKAENKKNTINKSLAAKELYKNEKYGFEFVSPQNLFIESSSMDDNVIFSDKIDGHWLFQISMYDNSDSLSLKDISDQEIKKINSIYSFDVSDIKVGNELAKKILIKNYSDYGNITIILIHKNNVIKIHGDNSAESVNKNFESIIDSFKFSE